MSREVTLGDLLASLNEAALSDRLTKLCSDSVPVASVTADSRAVVPGALFVAIVGAKSDGHAFVEQALAAGASAVVVQSDQADSARLLRSAAPVCVVDNTREALAHLTNRFYRDPTRTLALYGVTGTNGKTSVTWLLANLLAELGQSTGLVGTLGKSLVAARGADQVGPRALSSFEETANTAPDPSVVQAFLAQIKAEGAAAAAVEVTSQGIAQHRTTGVHWDCAVFTNLTRDHLDLHGTIENYSALKRRLFTEELVRSSAARRVAILNLDDAFGELLHRELGERFVEIQSLAYSANGLQCDSYVRRSECSVEGTIIEADILGTAVELRSRLLGRYNVANILAAITAAHAMGHQLDALAAALPMVPPVPGRLEPVGTGPVKVFVDYAHTPDALENVQHSLRELTPGKLITVFGCGGDRDRGKRPLMGEVVRAWADVAVVTSDNPRTENPDAIISDILPGLERPPSGQATVPGGAAERAFCLKIEVAREKAIQAAIELAQPGDVVLVAGKGHEDYQEINGVKHHFLDSEVCQQALNRRTV